MRLELRVKGLDGAEGAIGAIGARLRPGGSRAFWARVGQILRKEALECFRGQRAPDGTPWRPLSAKTLAARAKGRTGRGRSGAARARTVASRMSGARILEDTGRLRGSLVAEPTEDGVRIGSRLVYARTHQQGDDRRGIPARPYLGLSSEGRSRIMTALRRHYASGEGAI